MKHAEADWIARAIDHLRARLDDAGPPEQRILHCDVHEEWDPDLLRSTGHHDLHVLGRSADLVVYFDGEGRLLGWRDDGRDGSEIPTEVVLEVLLARLQSELDLPKSAVLGACKPAKLAHVGWTHQTVVFLAPTPRPDQILHIWVDPKSLKAIQCLRRGGVEVAGGDSVRTAADEVQRLLARRIETATTDGIWTSRPEWYFQVEAGETTEYDGGSQVRVHTWRHWSDASVTFEMESGEVLADMVERFATPQAQGELTQEAAEAAVAEQLPIPGDAEVESFEHFEFAPDHRLARIVWRRVRGDLPVEGDYLDVSVHPDTKRIVRYDRKWRALEPPRQPAEMTMPEAIQLVEARRTQLDIDPAMEYEEARKVIVEYKRDRLEPGPTEDRVAWIVTYESDSGWVEVHVDAARRKVLSVLRSA